MAAGRLTTATAVAAFWLTMMAMSPVVRAVTDDMLKIACEDMTPRHPGYKPENENRVPCPYRLVVHAEPVVPGDSVNLTLTSSNGSTPFKGFMIQARDYRGRVLGTFLPSCAGGGNKSHHMITCDDGVEPYNVAVQSNNKYKTKETFTWVAPLNLKGPFKFKYTVVQNYEHFWTNEKTDDIQVAKLSPREYELKNSVNHEYYIYKLYLENCFGS